MKLQELLLEGLIKLPSNLTEKMVKSFVQKYLAWVQDKIENELDGKDYSAARKLIDQCEKKYKVSIDDEDTESIGKMKKINLKYQLEVADLPYYSKVIKLYPDFKNVDIPTITLTMDFVSETGQSNGRYDPNTKTIFMYMKSLHLSSSSNFEALFVKYLPNAIGILIHELTHAIQFLVLRKFHDDQIANEDDVNLDASDRDKYFNSQIEFDPFVKVMITKFKTADAEMKKISPNYDRKLSLEYFTGSKEALSDTDLQKVSFMKPNEFFLSIKKHDRNKWKKAVKLFYQEVEK